MAENKIAGKYLSPEKMAEFLKLMASGKKDAALAMVTSGARGAWNPSKDKPDAFLNSELKNGTIQIVIRTSRGTKCLSRDVAGLKRKYIYVGADDVWPEPNAKPETVKTETAKK